MSANLTSGDVCEIAELEPSVFDDWCRKGIVKPQEGGEGQGNHRKFSLMQVVGLVVALQIKNSERGCVLPYVGKVVEAFGAITELELLKQIDKGKTHFVEPHKGKPLLQEPEVFWPNVKQIHRNVTDSIANITSRLKATGGRLRGLAGANNK